MAKDPELEQRTLEARQMARRYLSLAPEIWSFQQSLGHHVHVENPLTSDAWKELRLHNAFDVRIDQCSLGLRCPKTNNPALKPTRIVTSCPHMASRLAVCRCDHRHVHAHLEGNYKGRPLTSYAETYPRKMRRAIAEAMHSRQECQPQHVFAELGDHDVVPDAEGDDEPQAEAAPSQSDQRLQAMIRRLHVNLGHASPQQMLRLANRCQVSQQVKDKIKKLRMRNMRRPESATHSP